MMPPPVVMSPDGILTDNAGTDCCCDTGEERACCYTFNAGQDHYCQEVIPTVCLNTGGVTQPAGTTCTLGLCDEGDCPSCSNCGGIPRLVQTGGLIAYFPFGFPHPITGALPIDCPFDVDTGDCTFHGDPCEVKEHCLYGDIDVPPGRIGVKTTSFPPFCVNGVWHGVLRHENYSESTPGEICANPMTGEGFCGWDIGWRVRADAFSCGSPPGDPIFYVVESVTQFGGVCNGWHINYWTNPATYTVTT